MEMGFQDPLDTVAHGYRSIAEKAALALARKLKRCCRGRATLKFSSVTRGEGVLRQRTCLSLDLLQLVFGSAKKL